MLELLVIALAVLAVRQQLLAVGGAVNMPAVLAPKRVSPQLTQLTSYADRLYGEKKWLAAEKAYLNVLKLDHKNVTAYSHLGVIYSAQGNGADAIECFQIAAQLSPGAPTHQNLGSAYYENHSYAKAIAAFERAIMFEPSASRYLALARAYQKSQNTTAALAALERAAALEPSRRTLHALAIAYEEAGRAADARTARGKLHDIERDKRL